MTRSLIMIALLLGGCASSTKEWYRANASAEQFSADRARCDYESELGTPDVEGHGIAGAAMAGIEMGIRKAKLETMCLQAHGWQLREKAQ